MIKNERQYRLTKAEAERFELAIAAAEVRTDGPAKLRKLELDALRSQLDELNEQIAEYDALRSGSVRVLHLDDLGELPAALVKARIAAGLSQKDLADRLGMREQQVQRYEATDYAGASLARLRRVMQALGLKVRDGLALETAAGEGRG
jgi:ribosome-binding protein aMBF1 (putative translation factor)